MNYIQILNTKLFEYLENIKWDYKKSGRVIMLHCPKCKKNGHTAQVIPNSYKINCHACSTYFTLIKLVPYIEPHLQNKTQEEIAFYLKEKLNIAIQTPIDTANVKSILKKYYQWRFDLVPIVAGQKYPIEKDWTNKNHRDIKEWEHWIDNGLNIGVKTGQISNITVIDLDTKEIPAEIEPYLSKIRQETNKGFHFFYQYTNELPKTRIDELNIDIENDGGQVVIFPSIINNYQRTFTNVPEGEKIPKMPKELLDFLKTKVSVPVKTNSELIKEDIEKEIYNRPLINEGEGRNELFLRMGGMLRKFLSVEDTRRTLHLWDNAICNPILGSEIDRTIMKSIEKYSFFDDQELAKKVLDYIKAVDGASRIEVAMAKVGTNRGKEKERIDKVLEYLIREGYVIRRGKFYKVLEKVQWNEQLVEVSKPINFKIPYLHDVANFNWGDLILIASLPKYGKTTLSINIVKRLVEQGIKPYYINLEPGNRFAKIALQLGLKEGDIKWTFCSDPTQIPLEKGAITIIDWLMIKEKAKTDLVFQKLIEELAKTQGFLIVFQQLKDNEQYFAPNLINQFPVLSTRYLYEKEDDGTYGRFKIDVIREPKGNIKSWEIPCKYCFETKELKRIDELEEGQR